MNETKLAISSLAMDLKRIALGYHNGSEKTAKRFTEEAIKRIGEIEPLNVAPYIGEALKKVRIMLSYSKKADIAEDALMYSTIFQNYALNS